MTSQPSQTAVEKMSATGWKAVAIGFIPLIVISVLFGTYLSLTPFGSNQMVPGCQEYSCVHVSLNSNTSITGVLITLQSEPASCVTGPLICTQPGPVCNLPQYFCHSINTEASTASFTFEGVEQGYYRIGFIAYYGENESYYNSFSESLLITNRTAYNVVANMTALATTQGNVEISITNSTYS